MILFYFLSLLLVCVKCDFLSLLVVDDFELLDKLQLFKYYLSLESLWEDVLLKDVQLHDNYVKYQVVIIAINNLTDENVKLINDNIDLTVTSNVLIACQNVSSDDNPKMFNELRFQFLRKRVKDSANEGFIQPKFDDFTIKYIGTGVCVEEGHILARGTESSVIDGWKDTGHDIKLISLLDREDKNVIVCGSVDVFTSSLLMSNGDNVKLVHELKSYLMWNRQNYFIETPPDVVYNVNDILEYKLRGPNGNLNFQLEVKYFDVIMSVFMEYSPKDDEYRAKLKLPDHRGVLTVSIYDVSKMRKLLYQNRVAVDSVDIKRYSKIMKSVVYLCTSGFFLLSMSTLA